MQISIEELAENTEKYVKLAEDVEVKISRNGQAVARLTGVETPKMKAAKALKGILAGKDVDLDKLRMERIVKKVN